MKELYHLSFRELPNTLIPRQPEDSGIGKTSDGKFTEDLPPRVSFSPTIVQCVMALYPNISHLFEIKKYPHIDFLVYQPVRGQTLKTIPNDIVLAKVWDAKATGEVCITSNVRVVKSMKVRVPNPTLDKKCKDIYIQPFGDNFADPVFLAPEMTYEVVEEYNKP